MDSTEFNMGNRDIRYSTGVLLQHASAARYKSYHCDICQCRGYSHNKHSNVSILPLQHYANMVRKTFLSSLEERQKECRLYIDQIGDILRNNMSNMVLYMVLDLLFLWCMRLSDIR
jgi:hypothetical protein